MVIGEEAQRVADVQRDLEEGPSVGATFESTTILLLEDTATDDRWPRFAAAAKSAGVPGSCLSCRVTPRKHLFATAMHNLI